MPRAGSEWVDPTFRLIHAKCIAVRTITLDLEAYELLRRHKRGSQSFSQVVEEHFRPRHKVGDIRKALDSIELEAETLDLIDEQVLRRVGDVAGGKPL